MALASEGLPISGDNDVQHNQCHLKQANEKKVTFDTSTSDNNLIRSNKTNHQTNSDDNFELPNHIIYKLYLNRLFSAFADRTWDFACGM